MAERNQMNSVPTQDVATALNPERTKTRIKSSSTAAGQAEEAAWRSEGARLLTESSELTTLEDSLRHFGLLSRLQELDKSLMLVRRRGRTAEEHKEECKALDLELRCLLREHHPDIVMKGGGTEKEPKRAKDLQAALNAKRTILDTLHKLLLEEFVIDHKYSSFTKLDLGLLGNVEEEYHGYEVLYKIILVSEIMQECMIAEIRKFLLVSDHCIFNGLINDVFHFEKGVSSAVIYLGRCYECCKKLRSVLEELEPECSEENLQDISRLIQSMTSDLSTQLRHFEGLRKTLKKGIKLVPGELFQEYYHISMRKRQYLQLPVMYYVNVILSCSIMHASMERRSLSADFISSIMNTLHSGVHSVDEEGAKIYLLYQLASYYHGHRQHETSLKNTFAHRLDRKEVETLFERILKSLQIDLRSRFNPEDYFENGKDYILEGLTTCREMKAGFDVRNKLKRLIAGEEQMRRENDMMRIIVEKSIKIQAKLEGRISDLEHKNASLNNIVQQLKGEKKCKLARLKGIPPETKETPTEECGSDRDVDPLFIDPGCL